MRRRHSEITDPLEINRILSAATIGRMATLGADGYPYITPVNYVYTNACIYFHCALKGEKLDNIAREDRVCFEVDIPAGLPRPGLSTRRAGGATFISFTTA